MTKKLKFALFGNIHQERKSAAVQKFFAIATERKAEIAMPEQFYFFLRDNMKIHVPECEIIKDNQFSADYVVCMGGDGTFLDVASRHQYWQAGLFGKFLARPYRRDDGGHLWRELWRRGTQRTEHLLRRDGTEELPFCAERDCHPEARHLLHDFHPYGHQ